MRLHCMWENNIKMDLKIIVDVGFLGTDVTWTCRSVPPF